MQHGQFDVRSYFLDLPVFALGRGLILEGNQQTLPKHKITVLMRGKYGIFSSNELWEFKVDNSI